MRSGIGDEVRIAAPHGAAVEIAVHGDVDLASLGELRDVLDVAVHRRSGTVVVDLTAAGFVSCRAAALMVDAASALGEQDRGLELRGAYPGMHRLLQICGLGPHLRSAV